MEIRFLPSFPHAPPFFRVIRPRFRPFMEVGSRVLFAFVLKCVQGGGGHITAGKAVCSIRHVRPWQLPYLRRFHLYGPTHLGWYV